MCEFKDMERVRPGNEGNSNTSYERRKLERLLTRIEKTLSGEKNFEQLKESEKVVLASRVQPLVNNII